jgi:hypothetical protein
MFDLLLQNSGDKSDRTMQAVHEAEWETLKWVDQCNNSRPRYVLSKLLTCGCCGGGLSMINQDLFRLLSCAEQRGQRLHQQTPNQTRRA